MRNVHTGMSVVYVSNCSLPVFFPERRSGTGEMGRYSGKTCRLLTMLSMTASFFLVEIIVGYITNSIALVADSFHMLSDVVALIVGFVSVRVS